MASNELTADQVHIRNVAIMGEELGSIYSQLWQELAWLYRTWAEYAALFGTRESRVDLLNEAAPAFARIVQDSLWQCVILHIARLTDPPKSVGKRNLSVRALEEAVEDSELKVRVSQAVAEALAASEFCRDWRNRHLAHRDLDLALKRGAEPLQAASLLKVKEALASLSNVLNVVSLKYLECTTSFDIDLRVGGGPGGAISLLYYIDMGVEAEGRRRKKLGSGDLDANDYCPRDL
jgi:hypothetical protein